MTRDQAIRKVLACLRLSASSNPHEAASALRQARALMDKYGLTEADAAASEIRDAEAATRYRGAQLPRSVSTLAWIVAGGYRCEFIVHRLMGLGMGKTTVRFFGANADAQIAAYAFTVLRRQLEADKATHTKRIRKRANKDARGEAFALGWVNAVSGLFPMAQLPEGRTAAIESAMKQRVGATEQAAPRELAKRGNKHLQDGLAGYVAGKGAQLNNGLSENGQRRLEAANG